ncbi:uncharacterized protein LOC113342653 isoform X2 [Papaver somniferum]|uniref:uncharacterized protein LOC113342653 isoform X2 n=1 Tax=Papaver somniferum TaxID=3469 RepID=UPI000E703924|nr:uncharacterized protein LOC113342653 isoform X2 [Papaver somniferum]
MAEISKLEVECKAKCSAVKFFSMMTRDALKLPKYAPHTIHNVQVLPGDGEVRAGSVYIWVYKLDNKPSAVTTKVKRDGNYNCLVKWSAQYQKANKDVPDPTYVMKMLEDFTKELDTNLLKER